MRPVYHYFDNHKFSADLPPVLQPSIYHQWQIAFDNMVVVEAMAMTTALQVLLYYLWNNCQSNMVITLDPALCIEMKNNWLQKYIILW